MAGRKYRIIQNLKPMPMMHGPDVPVDELQAALIKEACEGDAARESAARHNLSTKTVTNAITELWKDLGCKNKKQMIAYCKEMGYDKLIIFLGTCISHVIAEWEKWEPAVNLLDRGFC